jgi:MinD-like ATPase involved in chromosome partitioning or flagellar assembly
MSRPGCYDDLDPTAHNVRGMLISLDHGHRRLSLSVPGDLPVESLVPLLVDACGADASATWALVPRGDTPLRPGQTLREAGMWPGALLALRATDAGERRPPRAGWPLAGAREAWHAADRIDRLERAIAAAPWEAGVVITVASLRPQAGATTITALLAVLLARVLRRPPLAIDAGLETRALSRHLAPQVRLRSETYLDVVAGRLRLGDLATTGQGPYGVALLPAPEHRGATPDATACAALVARLKARGLVVLVDCPTGFATPWGQAAWAAADQFVLVADGRAGDLSALAPAASSLTAAGIPIGVVSNRARLRARTIRAAAALGLTGPTVGIADDPMAAAQLRAGLLTWEAAPPGWRIATAELAASLAFSLPQRVPS